MSDFSRPPKEVLKENQAEGYTGIHFMQGVPILDRDLNLMQDLINETVRSLVSRYLGNGVPLLSDGFKITPVNADNDFQISANTGGPGFCLINGIEVVIKESKPYSKQPRFEIDALPDLSTPRAARTDSVYLDVFVETIDTHKILDNDDDIATQTSVRLHTAWTVRVEQGAVPPQPKPGHTHFPLAELKRTANIAKITGEMITDKRQRCVSLETVFGRLITPEITGLSKKSGAPNTKVTILGRNLDALGVPAVSIGPFPVDTSAMKPEELSAVAMTVTVPPTATGSDLPVFVSNEAGRSGGGPNGPVFNIIGGG